MPTTLIAVGSMLAVVWGLAHLAPTRSIVAGFGPISADNRRLITMEWVAEGLTLVFIGALPLLVLAQAPPAHTGPLTVVRASAAMLLVMAGWTAATGSRTSILPIKLCPVVKSVAAGLMILGTVW